MAKMNAETRKVMAESDNAKAMAEDAMIRKQNTWYPFVVTAGVASGATLAIGTLAATLVKLFL